MRLNTNPIKEIIVSVGQIFNFLIPVLIAAALVVFFWGLVKYLWGGGKDTAYGRRIMTSGLIALFVMVSVWGIVALIQESLGVDQNAGANIPQIPVYGVKSGSDAPCTGNYLDCLNKN
jgi:hypothetical protein